MTVDTHSHLMVGVDDGVATDAEFWQVVDSMKKMGTQRLFLTPHLKAESTYDTPHIIESAAQYCGYEIEMRPAAEYMLDERFGERLSQGKLLTYDGSHALVEFARGGRGAGAAGLLSAMMLEGYRPILAHPERYLYLTMADIESLKSSGVKLQLNILSVVGAYGEAVRRFAADILRGGHYDFAGSDAHRHFGEWLTRRTVDSQAAESLSYLFANNEMLWR